jgi:ketosteroid isomerase-like protein
MSNSSDTAEFKRQIEDQTAQYLAAFKSRDPKLCVKFYTDDVVALYPGSPPIHGRTALAKAYQELMDAGVQISGLTTEKYECDGKIGYAMQIAHTNRGKNAVLLTFRRGDDGVWLACGEAVPDAAT